MAYETLSNVQVVSLGGINKKTGKKNPTELEGYYIGSEPRPNKFNLAIPKNFYKFQTQAGLVGLYASAGIDQTMKSAVVGRMTKIVATGETLDTGKGNPMKVYEVMQDRTNNIDVDSSWAAPTTDAAEETEESFGEPEAASYAPPSPPPRAATVPSADRQARINAMLKSR